jgi:hypothetical protein
VTRPRDVLLTHALEEAGQYERADAPPGGTAWDLTRSLTPAAIVVPDCARDAIAGSHTWQRLAGGGGRHAAGRPDSSGFPPGWDADTVIAAVLAVARDPDRITWDDPAARAGEALSGPPAWRAEGSTGAVTIIVALRANGEITSAWASAHPDPGSPPGQTRPRAGRRSRAASQPSPGSPGPLPAAVMHLTAICRARKRQGLTADVQAPAPGRYIITICRAGRELTLTYAWRHRRWDLADTQLTVGGEPQDTTRPLYQLIRMLSDHEIGTGTPSHIRSGSPLPRDSALQTKKNTVLRV